MFYLWRWLNTVKADESDAAPVPAPVSEDSSDDLSEPETSAPETSDSEVKKASRKVDHKMLKWATSSNQSWRPSSDSDSVSAHGVIPFDQTIFGKYIKR